MFAKKMVNTLVFMAFLLMPTVASILGPAHTWAVALDSSGTGSNMAKTYTCRHIKLGPGGASKGPEEYVINLEAHCTIVDPNKGPYQMEGEWGQFVDLKKMRIVGRYYYNLGQASEKVFFAGTYTNSPLVKVTTKNCSANPWAVGASASGCEKNSVTHNLEIDNTPVEIQFNGPFPLSAASLPGELQQALADYENSPDPETLADWNPYAGTEGSNELSIDSPTIFQTIPESAASFELAVSANTTPAPVGIFMQWERLVEAPEYVGDIKIPTGMTHMFESFNGPVSAPLSQFPLQISLNSGPFAGKKGLYRVRVRGYNLFGVNGTGFTSWHQFWIGEPTANYINNDPENLTQKAMQAQQYMNKALIKMALKDGPSDKVKNNIVKMQTTKGSAVVLKQGDMQAFAPKTLNSNSEPEKKSTPAVMRRSSTKSIAPVLQGSKRTFKLKEPVVFVIPNAIHHKPVIECFDGLRWTSKCPKGLKLKKIGTGSPVRYQMEPSATGDYRLRVGDAASVKVKVNALRLPETAKKLNTPSSQPKLKALSVPTDSPSAPRIRLNQTEFKAIPAKVMIKAHTVPGLKMQYVLEKKINGRYKKVKVLRSPSFDVTEPGFYRVKASFKDGSLETVENFKVLSPKAPLLKIKKIKAKKQFRIESTRKL